MDSKMSVLKQNGTKEPKDSSSYSEKSYDDKSRYKKWRKKWRDMTTANKLMVSFTGVIAACTVVYAVVAYCQWTALLDSNKTNRDALESVQRAFVLFSPNAEVGTTVGRNRKVVAWQAHVPMKNVGSTGTKRLRDNISFYTSKIPIPGDFSFPNTSDVLSSVLGPKGEIQLRTGDIPIGDVILAQQNLAHIYVYGWAAYRDVFSAPHLTMFCYELFPNTIPGDLTSIEYRLTGSFLTCKKHNCQDEECRNEVLPPGVELPN
jgi:hypothetical protein